MAFVCTFSLTAEWHDHENKVVCHHWEGQLVRPTHRHTLKHTSRQSKSENQPVSVGLNLCVEIRFRWHSDFIFPQTSPFWFLQTGMSFNFTLFAFWCLALVTLSMLFTKVMLSLIHLIFKKLEVSRSQAKKFSFLTVVTCPRPMTDSFYQRNTKHVWAYKGMNKEIGYLIHSFLHSRQYACEGECIYIVHKDSEDVNMLH